MEACDPGKVLCFDDFVSLVDRGRATRVTQLRRCAGFSQEELECVQDVFAAYDLQGLQQISVENMLDCLAELGVHVQRCHAIDELRNAREMAAALGAKEVIVGENTATSPVGFWVFIQLLRVLCGRDEKLVLDRETRAVQQTGFSEAEVKEFRQVFESWFYKERVFRSDGSDEQVEDAVKRFAFGETKDLPRESVRQMLRSFHVNLNLEQRVTLEWRMDELGIKELIDFSDYLRLMHWMLDTNFADIQNAASRATTEEEEEEGDHKAATQG